MVWEDKNNNTVPNAGEPGVASVIVRLGPSNCSAVVFSQVATDGIGAFVFEEVSPGSYCVRIVAPDGWNNTTSDTYTVTIDPGEWEEVGPAGIVELID